MALATALLAITLNVLQPLVDAALMRYEAGAGIAWRAFCLAADADAGKDAPEPATVEGHKCCLGLPPAWTAPSPVAVAVRVDRPMQFVGGLIAQPPDPAVAIRDGPLQPRAPPALA